MSTVEIKNVQDILDKRADKKLRKDVEQATALSQWFDDYTEIEIDFGGNKMTIRLTDLLLQIKESLLKKYRERYREKESQEFIAEVESFKAQLEDIEARST